MLLPRISRRSSHPGPALAVVRAAVVILVFVLSIVAVVLPIVVPVLLLPIVLKLLDSLKHIRRAVERDFYPSFFGEIDPQRNCRSQAVKIANMSVVVRRHSNPLEDFVPLP